MAMKRTTNQVRVAGQITKQFETNNRLRKGDGLATILFRLSLEKVIKDAKLDDNKTIATKCIQVIGFADHIFGYKFRTRQRGFPRNK